MSQKWLLLLGLVTFSLFSQEKEPSAFSIDAHFYYGTMLRHNKNVGHLVKDHPVGYILAYNHKTFGEKYWQQSYNFPDWGISLIYQDFKNEVLGENLGLYGHYNFYFLNRKLLFRIGEGIAYNTNPFDLETNFKNVSYGSHLLASTYMLFNYHEDDLFEGIGMEAGITFVHHSNGSFKAPNSGTNVLGFTLGMKYNFNEDSSQEQRVGDLPTSYAEPIKFNFLFRGGVNEGDFYNLGQHPFYVFSAYADKRLNYQSTLQLGMEFFISTFLKKEIEYQAAAFPGRVDPNSDYKRLAVMAGHEFRLGSFAIPTQLGYYVYWPYQYESRVYTRVGVAYYFSERVFGVSTVKTHAFNAEAIEFGLGLRL